MQNPDPGGIKDFRQEHLDLFYQPQMSADGARVVAVEALLRYEDPYRGWLGPGSILKYFDTPEKMEALDWWVLDHACKDALLWPSITVSVNISATQFSKPDFADKVLAVFDRVGVQPSRMELEIVEAAFIEDFDLATANINTLRARGVSIALDDFGTGYSSLTYLLRMPIDKLKIDKCFIDKVEFVESAAIVQALVALAKAIGLKVTAEGVETDAQHRFLRAIGCNYIQGFLFSAAISVDGISRALKIDRQGLLSQPIPGHPAAPAAPEPARPRLMRENGAIRAG